MALLWIEGFEGIGVLTNTPDLAVKYNNVTNITGVTADLVAGRTGGLAVKAGDFATTPRWQTPNFGNKTTVIVGEQWKPGVAWPGAGNRIFSLRVGTTETMGVWYKTDGKLEVRRGTTVLATTASGVSLDTYHLLEFKVTINNTTGSYSLKVDGTVVLSATGVDTQETGDAFVNGCRFFGSFNTASAVDFFTLDDIYILDDTGSKNNNFIGEQKVVIIFPDADGSSSDFTPAAGANWAAIDDNPHDTNTTYVESGVSTDVDLNSYANQTLTLIKGIQVNAVARFDGAGTNIKMKAKSGATTDTGPSEAAAASFANHFRILEDDPDISDDWTPTTLNAAEFGFEVG